MWSVGAGENAAIAKAIDHVRGLQRSRLARFTLEHKIDPQEQSRAAHVAYQCVAGLQRLQTLDEMRADAQGVLLQVPFFQDVQNGQTRCARDGIAAKRAEKFHAVVERIGDFRRSDNRRQRKSVPDRLAQNHDVRNHALRFESPKMRSKTPESDLHFVGDADRACSADVTVNLRQIIRRKNDLAADARQRFCDKCCDSASVSTRALENLRNVARIFCSGLLVAAAIRAAVIIRERRNVNPGLFPAASGTVEFVGANVNECVGVPVVGVFQSNDVFPAGMRARQAQSQLIGLAAGVHKKANAERFGKQPRQPLGVTVYVVVKIARVGVEERELRLRRLDHARVAVSHERHIVVNVEIRSPRVVVQMLHPPANDFQRTLIRNAEVLPQQGAARGKCLWELRLFRWKTTGRNSEQEIRIRRETRPYGTLRSISNTRKIGAKLEQIENDLKMNVWRPATVLLCRTDARAWLTPANTLPYFQAK